MKPKQWIEVVRNPIERFETDHEFALLVIVALMLIIGFSPLVFALVSWLIR